MGGNSRINIAVVSGLLAVNVGNAGGFWQQASIKAKNSLFSSALGHKDIFAWAADFSLFPSMLQARQTIKQREFEMTLEADDTIDCTPVDDLIEQKAQHFPSSSLQTPLETYLREINETSLLTAQEEKDLANQIAEGDVRARDRMVRANLRLVVNIARGYTGKGLGLQDLIEEGNLGLLRAVEGFDPTMGTRFSTYASYWIKQSIKRALINSAKTIRIPAYMVELLSKWRRATVRLTDELKRNPTPEEVARVLGLPKRKLPIIKKAIQIYNSTPQTDQAEAGWSLGEMVMDERMRTPEDELLENDVMNHIRSMMHELDERESTVLRLRFGLNDSEPHTLKEIGERLGLTRERVRQIETEALKKLGDGLRDPYDMEMTLPF